jgi:hypothetical protein
LSGAPLLIRQDTGSPSNFIPFRGFFGEKLSEAGRGKDQRHGAKISNLVCTEESARLAFNA